MFRYMKTTLMLAAPVVVYTTIYAFGVVVGNNVFNYIAIYMAACCAMLMLFFITRQNDDFKTALTALGLGACIFFASFYMVQAMGHKSYQQVGYTEAPAVLSNATIEHWLARRQVVQNPSASAASVAYEPAEVNAVTIRAQYLSNN